MKSHRAKIHRVKVQDSEFIKYKFGRLTQVNSQGYLRGSSHFLHGERETVKAIGHDRYITATSFMLFTVRRSTMPDASTPRESNSTHEMLDSVYDITLPFPSRATQGRSSCYFRSRKGVIVRARITRTYLCGCNSNCNSNSTTMRCDII